VPCQTSYTHKMNDLTQGAMVLRETEMPIGSNASAILVELRRDQRKPVMGSPAVSCSSKLCRTSIISGVFFRGLAATAQRYEGYDVASRPILPEKPQGRLILGRLFSVAAGTRRRVSPLQKT
jgi:hypothetical protein